MQNHAHFGNEEAGTVIANLWVPDSCKGTYVGEEGMLCYKQKTTNLYMRYIMSQICITLLVYI